MVIEDRARPTAVSVIGWIWVGLAALMAFSGAMAFVAHRFVVGPMRRAMPLAEGTPPPEFNPVFGFLFQYFDSLALVQVAFAGVILYSAVMFLRLRPWARVSVEAITWLALVYVVGFGVFWVLTWLRTVPVETPPSVQVPSGAFQVLGGGMGTVITLVFSVPLVVLLTFLRGTPVRAAFRQRHHSGA
jgi:hypothetical protein